MTKLDSACPASGDVYREYAAELRELARTATNDSRALYLKMANTWTYAAVRFEAGVVEPEREFSFFIFPR
jgi:hypothetical protein